LESTPLILVDACVLHSACCRDLLIQLDIDGFVRLRWSQEILSEVERSILRRRPDLKPAKLKRTFWLMNQSCPQALIETDKQLFPRNSLPDPNDRHVLSSAMQVEATVILTFNLKDFPSAVLHARGLKAIHPDDWLVSLYERNPVVVKNCAEKCRGRLRSPKLSLGDYKMELKRNGLTHLSTLI